MNEKFFKLPLEKQQRIERAAYKVFSQNIYKKAPMSEIADEGGISKALLFHYFTNKKDLYLYLWNKTVELITNSSRECRVLDTDDFFEMLRRSLWAKCSLMREYPHMNAFSLKAYYEQHPEIKQTIQESYAKISQMSENKVFEKMDTTVFRSDIDLRLMYAEIFYAVDGYLLSKYRAEHIVPDEIEQEVTRLIALWKQIYTERSN